MPARVIKRGAAAVEPIHGSANDAGDSAEMTEPARVLVVDDDERNLLAIQTVLEDVAEVVTATSGEKALRHLLKGEFAVILLDVFMPGMDGYETAQIIRAREQTKRIPIVFLSAVNKETEHLIRGYSMGAVDYVFKPVEPIVLRSKVAVFVDLFRMRREIQRKARQEQALLDENLRAKSERLRIEQELRIVEQRQAAIIQSLPIILYLETDEASPRVPQFVGGNFNTVTGFRFEDVEANPNMWVDRLHPEDRDPRGQGGGGPPRHRIDGDRISLALRRRPVQAFPRPGRAAPWRGWRAATLRRHPARRHRPQGPGKPAGPRPQDGRDRQADRRHRA